MSGLRASLAIVEVFPLVFTQVIGSNVPSTVAPLGIDRVFEIGYVPLASQIILSDADTKLNP
jgi:hypothetical protein